MALCAFAPFAARAGFTKSGTIGSSDVGMTLKDGTVYMVPSSTTLTRTTPYAALYVKDNSTAVIYIPTGVTFTVRGGNASGTESAGAGIRIEEGSTLIVTGEGSLIATGGNAANGAAAAIGGSGGNGGNGGTGGDGYRTDTDGDCEFTIGGARWTATVDGADTAAEADSVAPESLHIESVEVAPDKVTLVVSAVPDGWLAIFASQLRVRAGETLPLPDGVDALLSVDEVSISPKGDGTAIVIIPRTPAAARFFSVEWRSP